LSCHISGNHPNIYKAIDCLKLEETNSSISYYRAVKGEKPDTYRRKLDLFKDANINMLKRMIINSEISIKTYINNIVVLFCISYKKKKNNKDDESTSESEDISSDSDESDVNI
jgi:hypothetical protein